MAESRRTIGSSTSLEGTGLHTGNEATLTFRPADSGKGIVFVRTDLAKHPEWPAVLDHVTEMERRTSIGDGDAAVHTVEHVLAAAAAHGIDDLRIEVDGPEPPMCDGSAGPYFRALAEAGIAERGDGPVTYRIRAPFTVREGDASYIVAPADRLRLTVTIEWDHPRIGRQSGCYEITPERFNHELADARTFGFQEEEEILKAKGLAHGATTANMIVLSTADVVGTELRWPDEFVRHKAVDLLGDLVLLGGRLAADVVAVRPSHRGNLALVSAIRRSQGLRVPPIMGIQDILGVIPHRYPMLLVDRVVELEPGKRIVGIKNVTMNEPFFQGHFPDHPIMPGVLIVEAMAQVGGMILMGEFEDPQDKVVYFMSIDGVKFRKPVIPGDQIRFELEMLHFRGRNCRMKGVGYVDGQPVAEAEMMARVVDR